ncbi:MAG: PaaI family thioesterase [Tepidamorphaceae bacterium]
MGATVRLFYHERHLRPGGTVSGPAMMSTPTTRCISPFSRTSFGPVALAVTTNLSINFLRKPGQADLIADCSLLKLGKRLAVAEVSLRSDGSEDVVAHVVGTYSIPSGIEEIIP